jgi:hypothetical protein
MCNSTNVTCILSFLKKCLSCTLLIEMCNSTNPTYIYLRESCNSKLLLLVWFSSKIKSEFLLFLEKGGTPPMWLAFLPFLEKMFELHPSRNVQLHLPNFELHLSNRNVQLHQSDFAFFFLMLSCTFLIEMCNSTLSNLHLSMRKLQLEALLPYLNFFQK